MTPTYNRAYILDKAYASLKKQTSFDFEWIIVDDGSSDNTEELVDGWIKSEGNFTIVYEKQPNGGKHRAVNRGVSLAKYDYFLILDSDDTLAENAVELVHKWIADIEGLPAFAGVSGMKETSRGVVGATLKKQYIDATNLERKKHGLMGDKAEVYKTDVLRQYPFPEFEGENFIRESAVWDLIAKDGLKIRWCNEVIYFCEYIEDGLTKNTNEETYAKNFQGFTYCTKLFLQTHSFAWRLNKCGQFYRVAKLRGISKRETCTILGINSFVLNCGIAYFEFRQLIKSVARKLFKVIKS